MSSEQSNILKRQEQLTKWIESETDKTSNLIKEAKKIQFSDKIKFLSACNSNDWPEIERLMNRGIDINCTQDDGLTSLHQACIDDDENLVKFLINQGADIDAQDKEGWTPLFAAISCNYLPITKYLISCGARLDIVSFDGELPLDQSNNETIISFIKDEMKKRNLDADEIRNRERNTMLSDIEIMKKTQDFSKFTLADNGGSLLHVAASKDYTDVLEKLLEIISPQQLNHTDKDGWNALHVAAHWGHKRACLLLVDADIDFDQVTATNQTVLEVSDDDAKPYIREEIRKARFKRQDRASIKRPAQSPNIEFQPTGMKIPCQSNLVDKVQEPAFCDNHAKLSNNSKTETVNDSAEPLETVNLSTKDNNLHDVTFKSESLETPQDPEILVMNSSSNVDVKSSVVVPTFPIDNSKTIINVDELRKEESTTPKPLDTGTGGIALVKAIESESQRKDKARHARSVRRSTQNVTAEEIDEAKKLMSGDKVINLLKTSVVPIPTNNMDTTSTIISDVNIKENVDLNMTSNGISKELPSITVTGLLSDNYLDNADSIISLSNSESLEQLELKRKTGSHLVNKMKTRDRLPTGIELKDIQAAQNELVQVDQAMKPQENVKQEEYQIDYKALYENELKEKEKLQRNVSRLRRDLDESENTLKNLQNNHVILKSQNQTSAIMSSKCEILTIDRLRDENKKMKEANSALIRVISRLSHPSSKSLSTSS